MKSTKIATLVGLALTLGAPVSAQTQNLVTLKSLSGDITIEGDLVAVEEGKYVLYTAAGLLRVPVDTVYCEGACPDVAGAPQAPVNPVATAEPAAPAEPAATAEVAVAEPAPAVDVPADKKFGIHGSRTIGTNLLPNLLKGYAASIGATYEMFDDNPKERIVRLTAADGSIIAEVDLQTKGSGSAFPALAEGKADFGMADRRMKEDDLTKLTAGSLTDLRDTQSEVILGLDGIVVLVHPSNPMQNISFEELSRIYSGEVTNWSQLGGPDLPIVLHSFPDGSGDRSIFLSRALDPFGKTELETAVEHEEYAEMRDAVLADPAAIGFLGRAFVGDEVKVLPIREQCGLVSPPTNFRMKTEGYAMSRRLYIYRDPTGVHPVAQALLDFTFSPEGQKIIVESGFVDRELENLVMADMSVDLDHAKKEPDFNQRAFDRLVEELGNAERLSVAFRFAFSTAALDPLSERAVGEFAAKLQSGNYAGKDILIAGFADSVGSFAQNERLALARAQTVVDVIRDRIGSEAASGVKLTPVSYGELLPYLCNEDEFGRDANRRVEIWVR
jgi:phosphate transport system substrate-binding protein